ncbi:MAG: hypothetical protein V1886_02440 [archaeon]
MGGEKIEEMCRHAVRTKNRRGEALLCLENFDEKEILLFYNFPDRLSNVPYCIATKIFSTGHSMPDFYIDIDEMKNCEKRKK